MLGSTTWECPSCLAALLGRPVAQLVPELLLWVGVGSLALLERTMQDRALRSRQLTEPKAKKQIALPADNALQ